MVLPEPPETKWQQERRAFLRLLPSLLPEHRGQYVAIHEGQVVESGPDLVPVALLAHRRCGNVPIYVDMVSDEPARGVRISGPRRCRMTACHDSIPGYDFRDHLHLRPRDLAEHDHRAGSNQPPPPGRTTGADITVIPSRLADALVLPRVRMLPVKGFGEHSLQLPTMLVEIAIRQLQPVPMEALLNPDEPYVILGRDLLNCYRIVLDGPQLALEIG